MENSNLVEIIKIQSFIITKLGKKFTDDCKAPFEKQEMIDLLKTLNEKLKSI